jgi:hypothetical protein
MIKSIKKIQKQQSLEAFYFEFLTPAIPTGILETCEEKDIILMLKNLIHLVGKRLVNDRSILENQLAYNNISITKNKNIKRHEV